MYKIFPLKCNMTILLKLYMKLLKWLTHTISFHFFFVMIYLPAIKNRTHYWRPIYTITIFARSKGVVYSNRNLSWGISKNILQFWRSINSRYVNGNNRHSQTVTKAVFVFIFSLMFSGECFSYSLTNRDIVEFITQWNWNVM